MLTQATANISQLDELTVVSHDRVPFLMFLCGPQVVLDGFELGRERHVRYKPSGRQKHMNDSESSLSVVVSKCFTHFRVFVQWERPPTRDRWRHQLSRCPSWIDEREVSSFRRDFSFGSDPSDWEKKLLFVSLYLCKTIDEFWRW